ncbi:uncharacterized protein LOC143886165 [Tasmannia lanceolata]|uniref:uncharacterized protein LOC143886165 n=1 Tax=Tasmannia lanceolata TaxID=3420 RepID=UPI004062A7CB
MSILRLKTRQETNCSFTEDELKVAGILLQLRHLIVESKPIPILRWGIKRNRSVLNETPSLPPTPLLRIRPPKKTHKELKDNVHMLSTLQEQLKHEVMKVKEYYEKLKAENLVMKERQLKLGNLQSRDHLDLKCPIHQPSRPSIIYSQSPCRDDKSHSLKSRVGLTLENYSSHNGIPCLNFSFLEATSTMGMNFHLSFDQKKVAMAALARKRRVEINKGKSCLVLRTPCLR